MICRAQWRESSSLLQFQRAIQTTSIIGLFSLTNLSPLSLTNGGPHPSSHQCLPFLFRHLLDARSDLPECPLDGSTEGNNAMKANYCHIYFQLKNEKQVHGPADHIERVQVLQLNLREDNHVV